ncbi:MAG: hypothetical protein ACAH95_02430 [Fimbriimonas sp.]
MMLLPLSLILLTQQGSDPGREFLLTQRDAILLAPPEVACPSVSESLKWSSDGKQLAIRRSAVDMTSETITAMLTGVDPKTAIKAQTEIVIWTAAAKTSRKVLSLDQRISQLSSYDWLAGSSSLVAEVYSASDRATEIWFVPNSGNSKKIISVPFDQGIELVVSPTKPLAAIATYSREGTGQASVRFLDGTGKMTEWSLPPLTGLFQWSPDGSKLLMKSVNKSTTVSGAALPAGWYAMNPQTGSTERIETVTEATRTAETGLQAISTTANMPSNGAIGLVKAPIVVLFEAPMDQKEPSYAIVGTDSSNGAVSPNGASVAYISQGIAMVRALVHVPKEAFLKAKAAALKAEIMNKGKQVGLALQMFAADMDDAYPENKGWEDKLMPYLGNRQMIDGFNYTYAGGPLNGKDPSKTSLGFFSGPGGRANVYADGHVEWENNP